MILIFRIRFHFSLQNHDFFAFDTFIFAGRVFFYLFSNYLHTRIRFAYRNYGKLLRPTTIAVNLVPFFSALFNRAVKRIWESLNSRSRFICDCIFNSQLSILCAYYGVQSSTHAWSLCATSMFGMKLLSLSHLLSSLITKTSTWLIDRSRTKETEWKKYEFSPQTNDRNSKLSLELETSDSTTVMKHQLEKYKKNPTQIFPIICKVHLCVLTILCLALAG